MNSANEVLVVGGGVIGLAIALELKLRGAEVTVLSRDVQQAATQAAAGMLAPSAEDLAGDMFQLCHRSRALYADWTRKLEDISGSSTGYWACGILAPQYESDQHEYVQSERKKNDERERAGREQQSPIAAQLPSRSPWLSQAAIHLAQPGLGSEVMGGWWYPEDGQVDNRALAKSLRTAAETLGVDLRNGVTVTGVEQQGGQVTAVQTTAGDWRSPHYVLATGAWSQALLPVPVQPRKGQMLSLSPLPGHDLDGSLQRILYGQEVYIVPRQDGRIVVGATNEAVGFTPYNTPVAIAKLLAAAMRLYPALQHLPIEEFWWGFRPATPDELPILGRSLCSNLTLATGHYRNGILLAPITAKLIADWVLHQQSDPLLDAFAWERFYAPADVTTAPNVSSVSGAIHAPHRQANAPSVPVSRDLSSASPSAIGSSLPSSPPSLSPMLQYSTPADSATLTPPLTTADTPLIIANRPFRSRLMTGTGKYANFDLMRQSVASSGSEIVTVAVRRVQTNAPGHEGLAEALDWTKIWMLPNTAGCKTAEEAIRVARLGREMAKLLGQEDNNFVKLEVIPDAKYLLPDPFGTLEAAEQLVKEGFAVLPYINADPLLAKRLEEVGCATVMPLGSPIGSGQGIKNAANIQIIIENATVPVVVDAGIGAPSEAAEAMEMGADALLINTAIAQATNPVLMGQAMGLAAQAGRMAYLAGRIPVKGRAIASSPLTGTITS